MSLSFGLGVMANCSNKSFKSFLQRSPKALNKSTKSRNVSWVECVMELILLSPVPTPNEILRLFILYRLVKLKVELRGRNPKLGLSLQFWFKLGSLALLADRFISGLICRNGLGELFWQCVIFSFCFWEALATADPDFGLSCGSKRKKKMQAYIPNVHMIKLHKS